ncbi:MAG TPA: hypothetical protein VMM84_09440 [Pyrinomonadaceae bacterium]|nr:hypothetical protein [Pyrinomonadaceae bacterium]
MNKAANLVFVALISVVICAGIIASGKEDLFRASTRNKQHNDLRAENKTQALQVLAIETTANGHLRILFKNVSLKDVNGYVVVVGNGRITIDLSTGDRVMPPGTTDDLELPPRETTPHIAVLAVMFADGSIEGDPAIVTELTEWRSGIKLQLSRAIPLIEAALQSPDVNTSIALDRLESQISSLSVETDTIPVSSSETQGPDQEEARLTYRVISGLRSARDDLLTNIRLLRERANKHGTHKQRERLLELKQRIERRIARI